jgi:CheY-like chemotaxis protein
VDVLRELRSASRLCGLPPVIAATGNTSQHDRGRYEAAGFVGVLGKPFSLEDLRRVMKESVPGLLV